MISLRYSRAHHYHPFERLAGLPAWFSGLGLSLGVTALAYLGERLEVLLFGRAWLEALVLAILIGAVRQTLRPAPPDIARGIAWTGKVPLEIAIVLLGLGISPQALAAAGPLLIAGVAGLVAVSIGLSYGIGRALGLGYRQSLLIAAGNSICGNSAIAAMAPVIKAHPTEVGAAVSFTAVLGVLAVLGLPLLVGPLDFGAAQYGMFAGLTVYAVPQVLAATAPVSAISVGVGTLTKVLRVLMLGPVLFGAAILTRAELDRPRLGQLLPWFIVGFLLAIGFRAAGLVPLTLAAPASGATGVLTTLAMAALGLGVDIRALRHSGGRVILAATLGLACLGMLAWAFVHLAGQPG